MSGNIRGGDDMLIGGDGGSNSMFGDGGNMVGDSRGGNDTLIGGDGSPQLLVGDVYEMLTTPTAATTI